METEKLYYADAFMRTFTATVLTCEPGKGGYLVTLNDEKGNPYFIGELKR